VFILGARAESSLPPHVWEQITYLFPFTQFKIYFIGPQAALPAKPSISLSSERSTSKTVTDPRQIYSPATPVPSSETTGRGRVDTDNYGVPSYTLSVSSTLQLITLQARYEDVHEQFGPFDPYTDVFFTFCPGFGFPSPSVPHGQGKGIVQAEREWAQMLRQVLTTKCPLFITAFSPTDLERDVKSLDKVPGVRGEYDLLLEPGENGFGSLKWEPADFDPRVMVRVNWGIWAIRGKRYEVKPSNDEE
jgi:splicing suppressor protein 51